MSDNEHLAKCELRRARLALLEFQEIVTHRDLRYPEIEKLITNLEEIISKCYTQ